MLWVDGTSSCIHNGLLTLFPHSLGMLSHGIGCSAGRCVSLGSNNSPIDLEVDVSRHGHTRLRSSATDCRDCAIATADTNS